MNYLQHPNLLVQFWASVNTEFDKILDSFVRREGWLFQDLGLAAKKANIGAIYRCVCTVVNSQEGKVERLDHFLRVNFAILDAAKTQWLAPWRKYVVDPSKNMIPPFLKRKQKVLMDSRDLIAMHAFNATMQRLPKADDQFRELARQLVVMFNHLASTDAFEFGAVNDTFTTPSNSVRQLLASKLCAFTKTIYSLKDLRDQLYYITHQESLKTFRSLVGYGRFLPQTTSERSTNSKIKGHKNKDSDKTNFSSSDKKWSVEEIKALENENDVGKIAHNVTSILKSLDFGPILTRNRLSGIADNLLDKELENCVKTQAAYKKAIEVGCKRNKEQRQAFRAANNGNEKSSNAVMKSYYSGDFGWVESIFRNDEACDSVPASEEIIETKSNSVHEKTEILVNDDDDDYLTDDYSDFEDAEAEMPSPKRHLKSNEKSASPSPRKRNERYCSMPTIL